MATERGLNLPATQGTSGAGNFIPGVYKFDYTVEDVRNTTAHGVTALRLPVNVSTAHDEEALKKLGSYAEAVGRGVFCLFEESPDPSTQPHGLGRLKDAAAAAEVAAAWAAVHRSLGASGGFLYEIFNEPFGYATPSEYLRSMLLVIHRSGLPPERCILDGFGYASDVHALCRLGWTGFLGYHFYPNWLPEGQRSVEDYSRKVQTDLADIAHRVYITEFGASLTSDQGADANCLRGLAEGLRALPSPVLGVYHWHGWHNGDSYDFWDPQNKAGAALVKQVWDGSSGARSKPRTLPVSVFRKQEMSYLVSLPDPQFPQMETWGWAFEQILGHAFESESGQSDACDTRAVPIQCYRKGESALYCHPDEAEGVASDWKLEKTAFYAYPPDCKIPGTVEVYEYRKGELTYYAHSGCDGFDTITSWGWQKCRVAFCCPC
ncbi:unnamed protein product [Effrenium voratum]|uniref:Glycoside hydrolase family 5 domain-containing protein n=1 Tax=Effrenium voratum TaxID=2562239 RepID=A0AA36IKL8_9DINO|nr:unnamed protein product [Effrenium voratum]CAJ1432137.1 unnamed protein product [Effrenium voratum]